MTTSSITQYLREIGARGGKATALKLTAKQKTEIGRKAAKARWKKARKKE